MRRDISPTPGCSILMTSAPRSPSVRAATGPAMACDISRMRTPWSGGVIDSLVHAFPCQVAYSVDRRAASFPHVLHFIQRFDGGDDFLLPFRADDREPSGR